MSTWQIAHAADALVDVVPTEQLRKLVDVMETGPAAAVRHCVGGLSPDGRPLASALLDLGEAAALAPVLASAVAVADRVERTRESLQVVWTGPESVALESRPTSEVITELVSTARKRLTLATYSASGVEELNKLLLARKKAGVDVRLLLERPGGSGYGPDSVTAFGPIVPLVTTLLWPREARPQPIDFTAMHVKVVIRDDDAVLISSANLSTAGKDRNMELGVLITGLRTAARLQQHIDELAGRGVLVPLAPSVGGAPS